MALSNCIIPIQARLDEVTDYGYHNRPVGALEALLSPANTSGVIQTRMLHDDGKAKKYQITYVPIDCTAPTDCSSTPGDICGSGTSKPVTTVDYSILNCRFSGPIQLTVAQYRDLCNFDPKGFTMAQIQGKMDALRRQINADVLADLCGYVGSFSSTVAGPKELALINPTTGAPSLIAETEIYSDFMDAGMTMNPIIVGGRSWNIYNAARRRGGVDQNGLNVGASADFNAYYDNQLQGVCGTSGKETSIAFAPQVVHFVNYLENVGDFQANAGLDATNVLNFFDQGNDYSYGIIQDPITKMYYDFNAIYDKCTKIWKLSMNSIFDTWKMPLTQCHHAGFTGVVKYNLCGYDLACPVVE